MFSWQRMHGHPRVMDGSYASDVIDQHAVNWCGACYLVAAAQMVQDRAHIVLSHETGGLCDPPRISLQVLMDHFKDRDAEPGWNVCHGGNPVHVLHCLEDKTCPMVLEEGTPNLWLGFARVIAQCPYPTANFFRVRNPQRIPPDDVKTQLWEHGPVVLEICAQTLKSVDRDGVVRDLTPREPNHAVCVVGIRRTSDATLCWVVRNSWGTQRVPRNLPADYENCVFPGQNRCRVDWDEWHGDPHNPGFCYLPTSFLPLYSQSPSPWIVCDITTTAS